MTITTVGFGDFTPRTYPGRLIIMFTAFWGAIMISFFVLIVSSVFELKPTQDKALHQVDVSRSAANAIAHSFKYFVKKKRYHLLKQIQDLTYNCPFLDGIQNRAALTRESQALYQESLRASGPRGAADGAGAKFTLEEHDQNKVATFEQQMLAAEKTFTKALDRFTIRKKDFQKLKLEDVKDEQMMATTRLIKKEVIDLGDTMDVISDVMGDTIQR